MRNRGPRVNLVLSGGGIKGIAYTGVFEAGEMRGFKWANIAGVSSGALAGAFTGAGYTSTELYRVLDEFDFKVLDINEASKNIPAVAKIVNCQSRGLISKDISVKEFLNNGYQNSIHGSNYIDNGPRGFLKNIITYSKEGCLFDGDYLEEWVYKTLLKRGVKTFADLRGGICDRVNPRGYRVRMTAVDATRKKIVVLPDEMAYYGINPDKFEVAKAVRMSTSVPFAFKPVELKNIINGSLKPHYFVDGGVLDNFPSWLISKSRRIPTAGFKLSGGGKKKPLSLDTPLNILKTLINASYDVDIPVEDVKVDFLGEIDTGKVKFLDFGLNDRDKKYLYQMGKKSGLFIFEAISKKYVPLRVNILELLRRLFVG